MKASMEDKDYANHRIFISTIYSSDVKSYSMPSVLLEKYSTSHSIDYPWRFPDAEVWIVGSVNGLVLIIVNKIGLFLWNPATRESKRLPPNGCEMGSYKHTAYGFGYDESSSDYKVIVIKSDWEFYNDHAKNQVKIYGLKSNSWSKIENFPDCILLGTSGKFVKRAFHWPARFRTGLNKYHGILTFNLSEETFSEISQPCSGESYFKSMIGVLDGCLCVLCNFGETIVDVWVMKEYGKVESWSKIFSVNFPCYLSSFRYSTPLFISQENNDVFLMIGLNKVWYNAESNTVKLLSDKQNIWNPKVDTCIETLVSPFQLS